jgi:sulfide dehydrogenase cytochrome subunit
MAAPASAQPTTQLLADSCAACHGTDGNSPGSIDALDDMKIDKFLEKMKEYKYEAGEGRIMGPITQGLSDAQIEALAEHFQTLQR